MAAAARDRVPQDPWKGLVRDLVISAAIGVAVMLFVAFGQPAVLHPRYLIAGAIMGLCIGLACHLLHRAFFPAVERLAGVRRKAAMAALFFVGGIVGWLSAAGLVRVLLGITVFSSGGGLALGLLVVGLLAVVVGSLFALYEALRSRLERSIEAAKENEYAVRELDLAAALQRRLLPEPGLAGPGWRVDVAHRPARWVAGDLYHVVRMPDGTVVVAAGDVAGKGMAASLVMASVTARLPLLLADRSLPEVFAELGRRLADEAGVRHFVALALVRFDPASGAFELVNAGLPDPYLLRAGGSVAPLHVPGPRLPLGLRAEIDYRVLRGVLMPADRLLLLTDGIPEATTPAGEQLGYAAMERMLARTREVGDRWLEGVFEEVRRRTGCEPEDDWTLVLLERTGEPAISGSG